jgi:hypothetical protein
LAYCLREKHRLMKVENRVMKRTFRPKREENRRMENTRK